MRTAPNNVGRDIDLALHLEHIRIKAVIEKIQLINTGCLGVRFGLAQAMGERAERLGRRRFERIGNRIRHCGSVPFWLCPFGYLGAVRLFRQLDAARGPMLLQRKWRIIPMKLTFLKTSVAVAALVGLVACGGGEVAEAPSDAPDPRVTEARAFLNDADAKLAAMSRQASPIFWEYATNINAETAAARAKAGADYTKLGVSLANATKQFNDVELPADLARKMGRLKSGITIPAPSTEGAADELATITTSLASRYGSGRYMLKQNTDSVLQLLGDLPEAARDEIVEKGLTLDQLSTLIEQEPRPGRPAGSLGRLAHDFTADGERICAHGRDCQ